MNYLQMKKKALGGGWWVDPSCVGAYCFKGVRSETEALRDMTGAGHDLTAVGSPVWNAASGYRLSILGKYLNNDVLNAMNIKTVICRYADMEMSGGLVSLSNFKGAGGSCLLCGVIDYRYYSNGAWNNGEESNYPGFITSITSNDISYRRAQWINAIPASGGVFAGSASELRLNGEVVPSVTVTRSFDTGMIWINNGTASVGAAAEPSLSRTDPCNVLAIAFYTAELSDMAHRVIASNMNRF